MPLDAGSLKILLKKLLSGRMKEQAEPTSLGI